MKVLYTRSFSNDLDKLGPAPGVRKNLSKMLKEIKEADSLAEMNGLRKIRGYDDYYRLRMGDYRLGLKLTGNSVEVIRFLHRKDIYRQFP